MEFGGTEIAVSCYKQHDGDKLLDAKVGCVLYSVCVLCAMRYSYIPYAMCCLAYLTGIQYAVCCVRRAVCRVLCTACCVLCAVCCVLCAACCVLCAVRYVWYDVCCVVCYTNTVCGVLCSVWFVVCAVCCVLCTVLCLATSSTMATNFSTRTWVVYTMLCDLRWVHWF